MVPRMTVLAVCVGLGLASPTFGQATSPRSESPPPVAPSALRWFQGPIAVVNLENVPAREALEWWSRMTGIDLVVDWDALTAAGVDLQTPITLELKDVAASRVLAMMMQLMSPEVELVYEATPWYVQVMTREEANRHLVVRVYDVGDLVMTVPDFDDPPTFSLVEIIHDSQRRQQARRLFGDEYGAYDEALRQEARAAAAAQEQEAGEALAQVVRESIEPEVGDGVAHVRYHHGLLIVKAPAYIHGNLGLRDVDVQPPPTALPRAVERRLLMREWFEPPLSGIAPEGPPIAGVR